MVKTFSMAFIAIFVALDIIGMLPIYLSLTHPLPPSQRRKIANQSMWVGLLVAILFAFVGKAVFRFLGIEVSDFKIAGGIILLLVSMADLLGGPGILKSTSGSTGIVPLAVPLITGPAVLTTVILQISSAGYSITVFALLLNYGLAWIALRQGQWVTRIIGKDGTVIFSKLAALLLAAIAVAMIRSGVFDSIHAFPAAVSRISPA